MDERILPGSIVSGRASPVPASTTAKITKSGWRATVAQDELVSERAPVVAAGLRGIAAAAVTARNDVRRTVT